MILDKFHFLTFAVWKFDIAFKVKKSKNEMCQLLPVWLFNIDFFLISPLKLKKGYLLKKQALQMLDNQNLMHVSVFSYSRTGLLMFTKEKEDLIMTISLVGWNFSLISVKNSSTILSKLKKTVIFSCCSKLIVHF